MPHILLGLNVIAFTSLFSAFLVGMHDGGPAGRPWARFYFYYLLSLAAWNLFSSIDDYLEAYVTTGRTALENRIDALIVLFVSGAAVFSYLHFVERLPYETPPRLFRPLSTVALAAYVVASTAFIAVGAPEAGTVFIMASFFVLCLFSAFALVRGGFRPAGERMKGQRLFLVASLLFFPASLAEYFLFRFSPGTTPAFPKGMFSLPVYCIAVSALALAKGLRRGGHHAEALPGDFLVEFGVTEREREIIDCLFQGDSSKKISAKLFISPRTVGNHLNNIYRKCAVTGRLELLRLIREYHAS